MSYDPEAIYQDADFEQQDFEQQGRDYTRREREARRLYLAGDDGAAAAMCPHGAGYTLNMPAADHSRDPFAGEDGWRCRDCGSRLSADPWNDGRVTVPCELGATAFEEIPA